MAKLKNLDEGDRVRWKTSQGKTTGKVVGIKTKPFTVKGTKLQASEAKPKVLVQSEKTGARAGHKPSALKKLKDRVSGKKGSADESGSGKKGSGKKGSGKKGSGKKGSGKKDNPEKATSKKSPSTKSPSTKRG